MSDIDLSQWYFSLVFGLFFLDIFIFGLFALVKIDRSCVVCKLQAAPEALNNFYRAINFLNYDIITLK